MKHYLKCIERLSRWNKLNCKTGIIVHINEGQLL